MCMVELLNILVIEAKIKQVLLMLTMQAINPLHLSIILSIVQMIPVDKPPPFILCSQVLHAALIS